MVRFGPVLLLQGILLINVLFVVATVGATGQPASDGHQPAFGGHIEQQRHIRPPVLAKDGQTCSQGTKIEIPGEHSSITARVTQNERAVDTPIITITINNTKSNNTTVTGTVTAEVQGG
jgi:hypothetical protein